MKKLLLVSLILIVGLVVSKTNLLVVFAQAQNSYKAEVSVWFSPKVEGKEGCQDAIIKEIEKAEKSICVAMYWFTDPDLSKALVKAKENKNGLDIRVLLDNGQRKYTRTSKLLTGNLIPVRYYSPPKGKGEQDKALMHHKFAVIDEKIVITGSYNWTPSAEKHNNEDLLIIRSPDIAKEYIKVWNTLWEKGIK